MENENGAQNSESSEPKIDYPGLLDRAKALMVDSVVILGLFLLVANTFAQLENVGPAIKAISFLIIFGLYDPLMVSFNKGTIGHKMMGLHVVREGNRDQKLALGFSFVRSIVKGILGWISFLGILGSTKNRALHDTLSDSIVVYAPKKKRNKTK